MKPSIFNFVLQLRDGRHVLLNTLAGAIDFIPDEALACLNASGAPDGEEVLGSLRDRGYLLDDTVDEPGLVSELYRGLLQRTREQTRLHCMFILSFRCNLHCTYCWQQAKVAETGSAAEAMTVQTADDALDAIARLRETVPSDPEASPLVQLFGGEPLLPAHRDVIEHILCRCGERSWPVQITTNGVFLDHYFELIRDYGVRELQVTIDGPRDIHNLRRVGSDYFKLMNALDRLIQKTEVLAKLRTNVDLSNVDSLPALTDDLLERQWYAGRNFYAYLAPLRDSGNNGITLIRNRAKLLSAVLDLMEREPKLEMFDMLGWDGYQPVRQLTATGRFPYPRVQICEANLNQFVFAPSGEVHVCAEEAHNPDAVVGRYTPRFELDQEAFHRWYDRSPLEVEFCRNCALLPVCGSGCQLWQIHDQMAPHYCRAVKECFSSSLARAFERGDLQ